METATPPSRPGFPGHPNPKIKTNETSCVAGFAIGSPKTPHLAMGSQLRRVSDQDRPLVQRLHVILIVEI
jgi:hypothetical protein